MLEKLNPDSIVTPFNDAYHHAVVIPPNSRILYIAGQVGLRKDGSLPDTLGPWSELSLHSAAPLRLPLRCYCWQ